MQRLHPTRRELLPGAAAATSLDLNPAIRQNPHLKVLSLNGYYDSATRCL